MSRPTTRLVVDASIAVKWFLNDEEHADEADTVLRAYRNGMLELYAPGHIRYEVGNALRNALRRGRITDIQGRHAFQLFLAWQIPTVTSNELLGTAYDLAIEFNCAFYDGLYLALARGTATRLVHADARLHNTLDGRFEYELWIEDLDIAPVP